MDGRVDDRCEMLPVLVEMQERLIGKIAFIDRFCDRFECANQKSAGILFDVDAIAGVAKRRKPRGETFDWLGHDVKVLAAIEWDSNANI